MMEKLPLILAKDPTLIARVLAGDPAAIAKVIFWGGVALYTSLMFSKNK